MGILLIHQLACDLKFVLKLANLFGLLIYDKFHLLAQMSLKFKFFFSELLLDLLSLCGILCNAVVHRLLRISYDIFHFLNFLFSCLHLVL